MNKPFEFTESDLECFHVFHIVNDKTSAIRAETELLEYLNAKLKEIKKQWWEELKTAISEEKAAHEARMDAIKEKILNELLS